MTKLIAALIAAVFAAATVTPVAFAADEKKEDAKAQKDTKKADKAEKKKSDDKSKAEEKK